MNSYELGKNIGQAQDKGIEHRLSPPRPGIETRRMTTRAVIDVLLLRERGITLGKPSAKRVK
ncbi:MAG: hypothetical protein ACM3IJ_04605 [Candidatus Levyibacteriota bacterium]